nr:unnamed protein product [Callosobruchus chinensis]
MDHLAFRRDVAMTLIQTNSTNRSSVLGKRFGRPSSLKNIESRYDRIDHFVAEQDRQTRCRLCHQNQMLKVQCGFTCTMFP